METERRRNAGVQVLVEERPIRKMAVEELGEPPHFCKRCRSSSPADQKLVESFDRLPALQEHLITKHSMQLDTRPHKRNTYWYVCPEKDCSRVLGDVSALSRHYVSKHSETEHSCPVCKKVYKLLVRLKQHQKLKGHQSVSSDPNIAAGSSLDSVGSSNGIGEQHNMKMLDIDLNIGPCDVMEEGEVLENLKSG